MNLTACPCWTHGSALGHAGHCCFLHDDRAHLKHGDMWRDNEDICHAPEVKT